MLRVREADMRWAEIEASMQRRAEAEEIDAYLESLYERDYAELGGEG